MYQNLAFCFPYGKPDDPRYVRNFLYYHMGDEAGRLYHSMRGGSA